jgi:hypothetical protein
VERWRRGDESRGGNKFEESAHQVKEGRRRLSCDI